MTGTAARSGHSNRRPEGRAQTVIVGLLPDQPALHGLLTKIGGLGLSLISARRLDVDDAGDHAQQ
jgi:hypothetical protein